MQATTMKAPRHASEPTRQRETLLYAAELIDGIKTDAEAPALSPSILRTCLDPALTALAQLGTLRTATTRSFLSFFDQQLQYIVAEATASTGLSPSLPLRDSGDELVLCGTARSRQDGICDYVVRGLDPDGLSIESAGISLIKVDDLQNSPRFAKLPLPCLGGRPATFYAAVPIRTKRGINIGVYCVMHDHPVTWWDDEHTRTMQEISAIMMDHLEARRDKLAHRRSERMNRGLSSFLQQKSTLTNWQFGTFPDAYANKAHLEGDLNAHHQAQESTPTGDDFQTYPLPPETRPSFVPSSRSQSHADLAAQSRGASFASGASMMAGDHEDKSETSSPTNIFGKAANILREAIEVEGCVILDPTATTFASFSPQSAPWQHMALPAQSSTSSSEDKPSQDHPNQATSCSVLGFSTSTDHSINGDSDAAFRVLMPQKFMIALLRRYPEGRIFNFDSNGDLLTSDSSDDSDKQVALETSTLLRSLPPKPARTATPSRPTKPWARQHEGRIIFESFPGARSVAMMPNWDTQTSKWRSVIFAYTQTTDRYFTPREELDYLRAFGMLTTEVALRQQTSLADKAKADALSCISHELRSPLHGVILGVELLNDTELSVSQGNISHTIETCCRTLVETIDHLLDFSKINYFMPISSNKKPVRSRGQRPATNASVEAGLMTLVSNVNLAVLAEDVVESVFSGFYFQHLSIRQVLRKEVFDQSDRGAFAASDGTRAMEDLNISSLEQVNSSLGTVSIFLMIDPTCCWDFLTEGGAIRRIIMNLFGNSLKHTRDGVIHVSLTQRARKPENRVAFKKQNQQVIITITDTGSGISQDYLENRLFQPFTQEDELSPGTGLGLSIVKKIVSHLRGRISVKSKVGRGTTVTVALPLRPMASLSGELRPPVEKNDFRSTVNELQGLRVCVLGFNVEGTTTSKVDMEGNSFDTFSILRSICADWLKLVVIEEEDIARYSPDLVIASDDMVAELSRHKTLTKAPTIIVCRNALVAHQQAFQYPSRRNRNASLEYISQPIGPRKLGKILLLVLNKWQDLHGSSSDDSFSCDNATPPDDSGLQWIQPPYMDHGSYFDSAGQKSATRPGTVEILSPTLSIPKLVSPPVTVRASAKQWFLLVDDNAINLRILSTYFGKLKQEYRTATNGQEAVDLYKGSPHQCRYIFMDISMPVMDGLEASRAIRVFEREHNLDSATIIALTGLASAEVQQAAFVSGVDLFLTKPVKLKELTSILKSRNVLPKPVGEMTAR